MSKKLIIVLGVVLLIAVIALGYFFVSHNSDGSQGGVTGTPTAAQPSAPTVPQISASMPADAPQGDTFVVQASGGGVTVKNFYKTSVGFSAGEDAILIAQSERYSLWYYRSFGGFEIALSSDGGSGDITAGTQALLADLGIDMKALCTLTVEVTYPVDNGTDKESLPFNGCSTGAFSSN